MVMFGISYIVNICVGNEYICGVFGGECKCVIIVEVVLFGVFFQCWDNSIRGFDSVNVIEFCKNLKMLSDFFQSICCVFIYQVFQSVYDFFDKVFVFYEGCQIFFGKVSEVCQYFERFGFDCFFCQIIFDFLIFMISFLECVVCFGWEDKVFCIFDEFVVVWKKSFEYQVLQVQIEVYKVLYFINGFDVEVFCVFKQVQQVKSQCVKLFFIFFYMQQIQLCFWRGWKCLIGDFSLSIGVLVGNIIMVFIIFSIFYNF